jgi:hypothetical protein
MKLNLSGSQRYQHDMGCITQGALADLGRFALDHIFGLNNRRSYFHVYRSNMYMVSRQQR